MEGQSKPELTEYVDDHGEQIERIIRHAIEVIEESKTQVFSIYESFMRELTLLEEELERVLREVEETIPIVNRLEWEFRLARIKLTEVSRDFLRYSEEDIKASYEKATRIQLDLMVYREKEQYLRSRRDELQQRIRSIQRSIARAESIGSQLNVVSEYLSGDLSNVSRILESVKSRQLLGLKIIMAQEEERKRVAREIHDGPAQTLANLVLKTEIAERFLEMGDKENLQSELADLKTQIRSGLEEIRKIIFLLRPMALDDLGLTPTLRKYVQDFEERTRIKASFEATGKERRLPGAMEVALFRLAQEALNNVQRHARATFVSLKVNFTDTEVQMTIQDNGVGFRMNEINPRGQAKLQSQFGLMGMRERVELLQGTLDINSAPGQGTTINIRLPLREGYGKE
jgi:two-component system sensor histidine kinase DegS